MSKIVRNIPDGLEASYADIKLDTISDLVNLTGTPPEIAWVSGYHTKGDGSYGSHIFDWDPNSTESHNGGTIIELGATFPTDWSDQTQLDNWYSYSGGSTGRYKLRYNGAVNVVWFGANSNNTGITNTTIIEAIPYNSIEFNDGEVFNVDNLHMPSQVSGNATLIGNVKWVTKKHVVQKGNLTVQGTVTISGVWYSEFEKINCSGNDFILDGYNDSWGTYWNKFENINCAKLLIDVDSGSVNENTFNNARASGGLHIRGVSTTSVREAHNNLFINIDTTGADLTAIDGSTGHHVVNDSDLNQTNMIMNWYAEASGNKTILGNWNLLCSHVDTSSTPIYIGRKNSSLLSSGTGRNGDFIALSDNVARGGDWSVLQENGFPIGVNGSGATLVDVSNAPDGNPKGVKVTGGATYKTLGIVVDTDQSDIISFCAYVNIEGSPSKLVQVGDSYVSASYTSLGNNWYLLRGTLNCPVYSDTQKTVTVILYVTTSDALTASDSITLGSFFITKERICKLPYYYRGIPTIEAEGNPSFINDNSISKELSTTSAIVTRACKNSKWKPSSFTTNSYLLDAIEIEATVPSNTATTIATIQETGYYSYGTFEIELYLLANITANSKGNTGMLKYVGSITASGDNGSENYEIKEVYNTMIDTNGGLDKPSLSISNSNSIFNIQLTTPVSISDTITTGIIKLYGASVKFV